MALLQLSVSLENGPNPSLCRKFQARIMPPNPKCLLQICTAPKLLIPSESVVLIPTPKLQKQTLGTLLI